VKNITGTDAAKYNDAVLELDSMLMLYEEHKDGRFLLQAYRALRQAEQFYPAYKATAEELGLRYELPSECSFVTSQKPLVLAALDTIVENLLAINETSSSEGKAQLLKALQWTGRGKAGSDARLQEQTVTRRLNALFTILDRMADREIRTKNLANVTSFDAAFSYVAGSLGIGKSNVRKIWDKAVESDPNLKENATQALRKHRATTRMEELLLKPRNETSPQKTKKPKSWR
jgi:hypothetical protein